jgi:hypothetical protein
MTEIHCELVQDRMPGVAAGRDRWSAEEARHIAGCADCTAVQRLIAGTRRLGSDLEVAGYLSPEFIEQMAARMRAEQRRRSRRPLRPLVVGLAAAAAVTLAVLAWPGLPGSGATVAAAPPTFLTELDSLDTAELVLLADRLAPPLSDLVPSDGDDLLELDSTQLERVLRSLEG